MTIRNTHGDILVTDVTEDLFPKPLLEPGVLLKFRYTEHEYYSMLVCDVVRDDDGIDCPGWDRYANFEPETIVMFLEYYKEDSDYVKVLYKDQVLYMYRGEVELYFDVVDLVLTPVGEDLK